jgi:hypothetical protein
MAGGNAGSDEVVVDVASFFGLGYRLPLPAFLVSTVDPDGQAHASPFSLVGTRNSAVDDAGTGRRA